MASDYLDELIARGAAHNPEFMRLFEDAKSRREQLRRLAQLRAATGLSQTQVAARMNTSQPVVARIESGEVDTKLSTLERYAAAIGGNFEWTVRPSAESIQRDRADPPSSTPMRSLRKLYGTNVGGTRRREGKVLS